MRGSSYFFMLLVLALNLFGLLHIMLRLTQKLFTEQALFVFLLVIASFVLFVLLANNKEGAWLFSALLFVLLLVNVIYLHFFIKSKVLNLLLLFDAITFIIAITLLRDEDQEIEIVHDAPRKSDELKKELEISSNFGRKKCSILEL